jgi:hypothetical protein
VSEIVALARFQAAGYVRSLRALYPLIAVLLLMGVMFADVWGGDAKRMVSAFADMAALMFPIWAFAAQGVLDNQPDTQRDLSGIAAGTKARWISAGLVTAYGVNVALALIPMGWLLGSSAVLGGDPTVMVLGSVLLLLAALPASLVGAWTCRALLPKPSAAVLALLMSCVVILLLGIGPLRWITVPMIGWMSAASTGIDAFTGAFPLVALQIVVWSAVVGAGYVLVRRTRP